MTTERKPPLRWWGVGVDFLAGIAVLWLIWSLIGVWAGAYLQWGQPVIEPSAEAITRYWTIAAVLLALLIFGFVVAALQRRTPAMVAYPIVGVIVLGTVLLFAVPRIDWHPDPVYPVNPNYCSRTDSENCPGG